MRERLLILECYRRAAEARRIADIAATPAERTDLLEVERTWLSLARGYGLKTRKRPQRVRPEKRVRIFP
jgi:hypothetical protein